MTASEITTAFGVNAGLLFENIPADLREIFVGVLAEVRDDAYAEGSSDGWSEGQDAGWENGFEAGHESGWENCVEDRDANTGAIG
jgi:hypothetical protein